MGSDSDESFWRLIGLTSQAMRSYADQRLQRYDLTVEQLLVLKHLNMEDGLSQNVLCGFAGKSPANITRILDRLEKKDTVVRRNNPKDRRSSLVFLTRGGQALLDEVISLFRGLRSELVEGISLEKQQVAIEVLKDIKKNVDKMSEKRRERE